MTRTAGALIGRRRSSAFWGLGCPKTHHEIKDSLALAEHCVRYAPHNSLCHHYRKTCARFAQDHCAHGVGRNCAHNLHSSTGEPPCRSALSMPAR
ncbi:MAG: hypothetical protein ABW170_10105 [Candidatus Thiodiazotropha sp. L084R]